MNSLRSSVAAAYALNPLVSFKAGKNSICTVDIRTEEGRKLLIEVRKFVRTLCPGDRVIAQHRLGENSPHAHHYRSSPYYNAYQCIHVKYAAFADVYCYTTYTAR